MTTNKPKFFISMIAAMSENRVIGLDGDLPWRLPNDLKFFKQTTTGHHLIMGRKTFESFGNPLPNRISIVITRQNEYQPNGAIIVHSLEEALTLCHERQLNEVFVTGGGEIYRQAMSIADRIYLTVIHTEIKGDTTFPQIDSKQWQLTSEQSHPSDDRHDYAFTFQTYERVEG